MVELFKKKIFDRIKKDRKKYTLIMFFWTTLFFFTNNPSSKYIHIFGFRSPHYIFSLHGNGDSIQIGQEIQCLPYAFFFSFSFSFFYSGSHKLTSMLFFGGIKRSNVLVLLKQCYYAMCISPTNGSRTKGTQSLKILVLGLPDLEFCDSRKN